VGIAGIVALLFLLNRRFADMAIFMVAALIVGGFVMAPDDIAGTVQDIWKTITA
jgi:putative copper export protein